MEQLTTAVKRKINPAHNKTKKTIIHGLGRYYWKKIKSQNNSRVLINNIFCKINFNK